MPTAQRRQRQRETKQRAASAAYATAAAAAEITSSSAASAAPVTSQTLRGRRAVANKSTQTPLDCRMIESLVHRYWAYLDRMKIDQAAEPVQIILGSHGGLVRSHAEPKEEESELYEGHSDYDIARILL